MKVLHIYKDYYPPVKGGIEGHINLLVHGLQERGANVQVLVSNTDVRLERVRYNGVPVIRTPEFGRLSSAPVNPTLSMWLRRLGKNADILHYHLPQPTAVMAHIASGLKNPVVVTYHSDIVRQKVLGTVFTPILLHFLRRAKRIIATSPNYVDSSPVLQQFRNKTRVIELGIDTSRFDNGHVPLMEIERLRARYGPRIVLFVGRFRYYKGLPVLLKAMQQVQGSLLLIGSGPEEQRLRRKAAVLQVEEKVHFLGELTDPQVDAYFKACDLFVLPSTYRSEAFGIVLLEAMASCRPVISCELGTGTTYTNKHDQTGIVVPPGDPDALAHSINYLLENPTARSFLGSQGQKRVYEMFTSGRMVDSMLELYQQIADETNGANRIIH